MAEDILAIRMRLLGAAQTNAGVTASAGVVRAYGDAVQTAGKKTAFAAEKSFLLGEGMYSLRRYGFYAITALGLTGAEVFKLGLQFDAAKQDGIDALTAIVGGTRAARAEVNQLIKVTHTSGLGLGFLVTETRNMLAFGYSVRDTNAYLSSFANFAGKKGLGEGGVSSLVSLFNRVHDTGFLSARDVKGLQGLGIPADRALGKALGLSPAQLYQLQHGQVQIGAASALPALAGYINRYANRQPYGLSQLFSILKGDISQSLGGAETPLFGWLRGKLTSAVTGYNRGGAKGALSAVDPSGGLQTFLLGLRNGAKVVGQTLHALWIAARPLIFLFGGIAKIAGIITGNLTAMKLILQPLIALYVLDRAQKIYQLGRDRLLGVQAANTSLAINGLAVAAERAAIKLSLIGGGGGATYIPGGSSTRAGGVTAGEEAVAGGFLARAALKGRGLLGRAGLVAKRVPEIAAVMAAFNIAGAPRANKYDTWTMSGLEHGFGLGQGNTWRQFGKSLGIPGLAAGGTATAPGWIKVGERGAEYLNVPRGASVTPLDSHTLPFDYQKLADTIVGAFHRSPVILETKNGQKLAEIVADGRSSTGARL